MVAGDKQNHTRVYGVGEASKRDDEGTGGDEGVGI